MTSPVVFMSIRELMTLVQTRQVSPVELAETFLARLETLGPQYNAVVTVTRERALQQARQAERDIAIGHYKGPLHGIPYGAKTCWPRPEAFPPPGGQRLCVIRSSIMMRRSCVSCRGRGCPGGKARHGRTGRWHGLSPAPCVLHRACHQSLGPQRLEWWIVQRLWRCRERWPGAVCHWLRNLGFNPRLPPAIAASPGCVRPTAASVVMAPWP